MEAFENLDPNVLKLIADYDKSIRTLKLTPTLRSMRSLFNYSRKIFENELPQKILKTFKDGSWWGCMVYFWKAGKYLNLLPKIIKEHINEISTLDMFRLIREINYNNWFTTNTQGLANFVRGLYYAIMQQEYIFNILFNDNGPITSDSYYKIDYCDYSNKILKLIKDGKIQYDPFYQFVSEDLLAKTRRSFIDPVRVIDIENEFDALDKDKQIVRWKHDDEKCVMLTNDELHEFLGMMYEDEKECESDETKTVIDEKKLNVAYQHLIKTSFNSGNFNLVNELLDYELPFYDINLNHILLLDDVGIEIMEREINYLAKILSRDKGKLFNTLKPLIPLVLKYAKQYDIPQDTIDEILLKT